MSSFEAILPENSELLFNLLDFSDVFRFAGANRRLRKMIRDFFSSLGFAIIELSGKVDDSQTSPRFRIYNFFPRDSKHYSEMSRCLLYISFSLSKDDDWDEALEIVKASPLHDALKNSQKPCLNGSFNTSGFQAMSKQLPGLNVNFHKITLDFQQFDSACQTAFCDMANGTEWTDFDISSGTMIESIDTLCSGLQRLDLKLLIDGVHAKEIPKLLDFHCHRIGAQAIIVGDMDVDLFLTTRRRRFEKVSTGNASILINLLDRVLSSTNSPKYEQLGDFCLSLPSRANFLEFLLYLEGAMSRGIIEPSPELKKRIRKWKQEKRSHEFAYEVIPEKLNMDVVIDSEDADTFAEVKIQDIRAPDILGTEPLESIFDDPPFD